tara:strand:+ start:369 stop:539 length:171 start_codon:yes stop_codon:yes gene_type:complete
MRWVLIILLIYIIFRITKPILAIIFLKKEIDKKREKNIIRQKINNMDIQDADYEDC